MADDILNHPDLVRADCQQCDWQSEPMIVDYANPNGLRFASQAVMRLHGIHSAQAHRQLQPKVVHLMKEARRDRP